MIKKKSKKTLLKKYLNPEILKEVHSNVSLDDTKFWIARNTRINELKNNL